MAAGQETACLLPGTDGLCARGIGRLKRRVKENMTGISGVVYAFQEHPLRSGSIRDNLLLVDPDAHRPGDIGYEFEAFIEKAKPWGLIHLCFYEKREQWFARIVGLGRNRCRVSGVRVVP